MVLIYLYKMVAQNMLRPFQTFQVGAKMFRARYNKKNVLFLFWKSYFPNSEKKFCVENFVPPEKKILYTRLDYYTFLNFISI